MAVGTLGLNVTSFEPNPSQLPGRCDGRWNPPIAIPSAWTLLVATTRPLRWPLEQENRGGCKMTPEVATTRPLRWPLEHLTALAGRAPIGVATTRPLRWPLELGSRDAGKRIPIVATTRPLRWPLEQGAAPAGFTLAACRNYQAAAMAVGTVPQPTVRKQAAGDAIRANQPKCKNENRRKRGPSNGH